MTLDITVHKNILLQILKDIYTDMTIGPILGFKGGTAAFMFYNLDRFSVDLDFDLLDRDKVEYVFERIEKILKNYGKIKESYKKRNTIFFLLSYEDLVQNIKVEINLRDFSSKYEIKVYFGISMKVMIREDMSAHKFVAMKERAGRTNRDIFDVCFFLKNSWPVNKEIIEKRTKLPFKKFLQKCIDLVEKKSSRNILSGIGELVNPKQKAWVKANLKKDTLFLLKVKLDNVK